jgi:hypothetical protein
MKKHSVHIGAIYIVKVSGKLARVRITRECDYGGWYGTNLATGRQIRIRSAARLRSEVPPAVTLDQIPDRRAQEISYDETLGMDDDIEF